MNHTVIRLFSYLRPHRWKVVATLALVFLSVVMTSILTYLNGVPSSKIAENLKNHEPIDMKFIQKIVVFIIIGAIIFFVSKFLAGVILTDVVQDIMFKIRKQIQDKLNRLPVSYFDSTKQGDVLSRVTNDVDTLSNALQQSFVGFINAILLIFLSATMMIVLNVKMGLIALLCIPLTLLMSKYFVSKSQPYYDAQQKSLAKLNAYVQERISGFSTLKMYGQEAETQEGFRKINEELTIHGKKSVFISGVMNTMAQFLTYYAVYIVTVILGIQSILAGVLLVGQLQSFLYYIYSVSQPITQMTTLMATIQSAFSASKRLFEFLDEEEEEVLPTELVLDDVHGEVHFEGVNFGYKKGQRIIQDFSLKVEPGQLIAIVGPTGAGKTTLINLLERFYDVDAGRILIDGIDIRSIERASLRQHIGMVLQDSWLYEGTIFDNLRFGKLEASNEEIIVASKAANLYPFIQKMPHGFDTVLSAEVNNLSVGQKQLLTIARALVSNPKILILDEATSSVDTHMELLIQDALNTLLEGKTSFVIAHRLSTIRDADLILVMESGRIVESGKHQALLEKNGTYAELYKSQFVEE